MDLKTAYSVLSLSENATLTELETRYNELTDKPTSDERLEQIQTAYNTIRDHINELNPPPKETWIKKTMTFVALHKRMTFFGIIGIIVFISFIFSVVNGIKENREEANNPPDLYLVFFGNFIVEDLDSLEADIKDKFPEWDQVKLHIEFSPGEEGTEMQIDAAQKSQVFIATERPDIYIFDQHHFDIFNDNNTYLELDQLKDADNKLLDDHGSVIGLDVTHNDMFSEMNNADKKKFMVIPEQAKSMDHATKFITKLAE